MSYANGYAPLKPVGMPYFTGSNGLRYAYDAIAQKVQGTAVEGKHISQQITHLGLDEQFAAGETPHSLPYSFSSYVPKAR